MERVNIGIVFLLAALAIVGAFIVGYRQGLQQASRLIGLAVHVLLREPTIIRAFVAATQGADLAEKTKGS